MDQLAIRVATLADLPQLLPMVEAYHASDALAFDASEVIRALGPLLDSDTLGRVWLVSVGGQSVGYLVVGYGYSIEFLGRDAFIDEFYIDAEHRGRGIGRQLLQFVLAEAGKLDIRALHLEAARDNAAAQHLYRSLGFEPRERYVIMSAAISPGSTS